MDQRKDADQDYSGYSDEERPRRKVIQALNTKTTTIKRAKWGQDEKQAKQLIVH